MTTTKVLPERATLSDFGGVKKNAFSVEDPYTDLDALDWNEVSANVASMTRTAVRAWVKFSCTAGGTATLLDYDAVWGDGYQPTLTRISDGYFSIDYTATMSDALLDSGDSQYSTYSEHNLDFAWVQPSIWVSSTAIGFTSAVVAAGNLVYVSTFNTSFAADDLACTVYVLIG